MKLVSLSDAQLALVMTSAHRVPLQWRDRFLSAIADQLLHAEEVSDASVATAVAAVLDKMLVAT